MWVMRIESVPGSSRHRAASILHVGHMIHPLLLDDITSSMDIGFVELPCQACGMPEQGECYPLHRASSQCDMWVMRTGAAAG